MVLNHKYWYWYGKQNEEFSKLYAKLWEEYHGWVLDNWKSEDLGYYFKMVN